MDAMSVTNSCPMTYRPTIKLENKHISKNVTVNPVCTTIINISKQQSQQKFSICSFKDTSGSWTSQTSAEVVFEIHSECSVYYWKVNRKLVFEVNKICDYYICIY